MNHVERFRAVMDFQPVDRLPRWEWAMWWDETIANWKKQGLPQIAGVGLRHRRVLRARSVPAVLVLDDRRHDRGGAAPRRGHRLEHGRLPAAASQVLSGSPRGDRIDAPWATRQAGGEAVVWITLEGYFWFPRTLMGFTKISLAFYDQPELLHQINQDLTDFNLRILDQVEKVCVPTFATIAEDMSYNNGPMISERHFDEFIAPYYRQIVPRLLEKNIIPLVDTDGDVTLMVPWLMREGIRGVLPLERQAGVDGMELRQAYPAGLPGGPLRQDGDGQGRGGDARRIRTTPAPDALGRLHSERRSPDATARVARPVSALPPPAGRVHRALTCMTRAQTIDEEHPVMTRYENRSDEPVPVAAFLGLLLCFVPVAIGQSPLLTRLSAAAANRRVLGATGTGSATTSLAKGSPATWKPWLRPASAKR